MPKIKVSDEEFSRLYNSLPQLEVGRILGISDRAVRKHRLKLVDEGRFYAPEPHPNSQRYQLDVPDGTVLVGSDGHYWPGKATPSHRAFVYLVKKLKPQAVVINGDAFDGASISRFPPIGWENVPTVAEELEAVKLRLGEISSASPEGCKRVWTLGNHDARFETRLATVAPEYADVEGIHLKDHFPWWTPAWSCEINNSVIVKHRFKGGVHAAHNNTLWSGRSIVTGHLHALKVTPLADYNGVRFGVECGTMADPQGPQWSYCEDNPKNWCQGFVVLTFREDKLLWPEVCHVIGPDAVEFRGEVIHV